VHGVARLQSLMADREEAKTSGAFLALMTRARRRSWQPARGSRQRPDSMKQQGAVVDVGVEPVGGEELAWKSGREGMRPMTTRRSDGVLGDGQNSQRPRQKQARESDGDQHS
jgi:hypothetical protein